MGVTETNAKVGLFSYGIGKAAAGAATYTKVQGQNGLVFAGAAGAEAGGGGSGGNINKKGIQEESAAQTRPLTPDVAPARPSLDLNRTSFYAEESPPPRAPPSAGKQREV